MKHSEEQIKEIARWREDLVKQIDKHSQSIEILEKRLLVLDSMLKESSFKKASSLDSKESFGDEEKIEKKSIPITSGNDGKIIANAFVTPQQVEIILEDDMKIAADIPPFKSFFIDRIIGEMKRKDTLDVDSGKIQKIPLLIMLLIKMVPTFAK